MNEQQLILSEGAPPQGALFDYEALEAEVRIVIRQRAVEIKTLAKRVTQDTIEIGGKLAEVKDQLGGNGKFAAWVQAELGWSERTAYNFIAVHQTFGQSDVEVGNIAASALYLLSAPSTPPAAVETAKQIVKEGGKVTHTVAKSVVKEAKAAEERAKGELFEDASADEDEEVCLCECKASDHGENGRCKKCACEVYEEASAAQIEEMEADAVAIANAAGKQGTAIPVSQATMDKLKKGTPPAPKLDAAAKEIEQAWRKAEVTVSLRFMPADKSGRKVLVTIQAEGLGPVTKLKQDSDVGFIGPVLEMFEAYKRDLPKQIAAKKATKTPAKPAAKAAKKGAKK